MEISIVQMKNSFDIIFKVLLTIISPTLNSRYSYKKCFGKKLDLNNPITSNEKVLWLKLNTYSTDPLVLQCANKYTVREYVKQCGCEEILNPLLGVYDSPDEIDFDKLPNKFALKSNYYFSYNIICKDKSTLNIPAAKKEMRRWNRSKMHLVTSEMQYANMERKILCERFIETSDGQAPNDYKIYCCNGKPVYAMVCIGREKGQVPKFYYVDRDGNVQRSMSYDGLKAPENFVYEKPEGWDKLFEYAEKLSTPFPFVRADFYLDNGNVIFGELTFTPGAGLDITKVESTDLLLGNMIQLPKK